jgi:hypothetical protein
MAFRRSTVRSRSAPPTRKTRRDAALRVVFISGKTLSETAKVNAKGPCSVDLFHRAEG